MTWQEKTGGTWSNFSSTTYTAGGTKTADLSGSSATEFRVRVDVTVTGSSPAAEIGRDAVYFTNHAPTVDSGSAFPSGGEISRYSDVTLSASVSDVEFTTLQGDTVTAEFYVDGAKVDEATTSSAGTVSHTATGLSEGNHSWHLVLTDEYGGTTTSSMWNFEVAHEAPSADDASADPSGGEKLRTGDPTLSINISDADFPRDGDTVTADWFVDGTSVGTTTVTSNSTATFTPTDLGDGSHSWHVELSDDYGYTTTSEAFLFTVNHDDPVVDESSASPTGGDVIGDPTLSVNVSDGDFSGDGDSLTAEFFVDESSIGTDTLSSNSTASMEWSGATGGSHEWHVEVTDQYGQTVRAPSGTWSFAVPAELYIRNETNYDELITGSEATVTLRFFGNETVVEKTTTDGTISLDGLPVNEELVVVARADGFYDRRIVLTSLIEQQSIYLLNETEPAVLNRFSTDDQSGQFSASETKLYVEKPLNTSTGVRWVTIAGDYVGAADTFPVELAKDARYRIKVQNTDGDVRGLGSYIATNEGQVPLTIGKINWQAPDKDTLRWEVFTSKDGNVTLLNLQFADPNPETPATDFEVTVYERGNESNVLFHDSVAELQTYDVAQPLSTNQSSTTWVVAWSVDHQDATVEHTEPVGAVAELPIPIDAKWATPFGFVLIVAIAAAFPSSMSRVGAMALVAVATGMSWLGWANIPMVAIGIAGAIALLGATSEMRGV